MMCNMFLLNHDVQYVSFKTWCALCLYCHGVRVKSDCRGVGVKSYCHGVRVKFYCHGVRVKSDCHGVRAKFVMGWE
jgi:hypothetical protein